VAPVTFSNRKNEVGINTNFRFEQILQSPTVAMADKVGRLKAQGIPIIGLQTGDPDFNTHPRIVESALLAINQGKTHYGQSQGSLAVRQAIAQRYQNRHQIEFNPESEVLLTHGGIHAFYVGLQAIMNPGDEFIIPDPSWATHANMVRLLGGIPIRIDALPEEEFLPSIDAWRSAITTKTKGIIINYPSNPTGVYPQKSYLEELISLCQDLNLWVVSDEVYENLYFAERPISIGSIKNAKGRVLLVNSFSKTYAMTGWRVGYLCAPEQIISNALKAGQLSITCVAPFIQEAALTALTDFEVNEYAEEMRRAYSRRRQLVLDMTEQNPKNGIRVKAPMGAFYYFLDVRALGLSSYEISERLLTEAYVGVTAGAAFGRNGEGFIRMTIAASDAEIKEGFAKICEWAGRL